MSATFSPSVKFPFTNRPGRTCCSLVRSCSSDDYINDVVMYFEFGVQIRHALCPLVEALADVCGPPLMKLARSIVLHAAAEHLALGGARS